MDKKQAIKELNKLIPNNPDYSDKNIALTMAIKSLEKVEELERWNKVLQDRIDFFEKKQGCEYCASEPLGDYCNLEYYNKYLLEMWDEIKEELEKEMNEYENVLSDLSYSDGLGYALATIEEHLKEIKE